MICHRFEHIVFEESKFDYIYFYLFIFREKERPCMSWGEGQREGCREGEGERDRETERENLKGSMLSAEPNMGLDLMTLGS